MDSVNVTITVLAIINIIGVWMMLDSPQRIFKGVIMAAWAVALFLSELGFGVGAAVIAGAAILLFLVAWGKKSKWEAGEVAAAEPFDTKPLLQEAQSRMRCGDLPKARDAIVAHLKQAPCDTDAMEMLRACDDMDRPIR